MNGRISLKTAFVQAIRSRVFLALWIFIVVQTVVLIFLTLSLGKIGQPGVPYRYDGFSATGIFRDNGLYLLNFAFFAVAIPILNSLASLKMYAVRGRSVSLGILWLTVIIMLAATIFVAALLNLGNVL
ncbi:MAG: hypothetical protein LBU20_01420 [Candidatus Nomurabacteria bacterium]|jgi:hypothetical protein|nr:hypothetical protein [Candidatus Nomurabacteria bacterium]